MKIKVETIVRTIVLAIALVNQSLTAMGKNPLPFADETLYEFLTILFTFIASGWAWWKNNSFTKNAIAADAVLSELKVGGEYITTEFSNGKESDE